MSTSYDWCRTEDERIDAEARVFQFSGPHFHSEYPKDSNGEFTRALTIKVDRWGNTYKDFATIQVPCDGCWY